MIRKYQTRIHNWQLLFRWTNKFYSNRHAFDIHMCFTFCHLTLAVVFTFCHLTLAVVFSQNILKMCGPYDGTFIVAYCYLETNILQSDKSKNVHRNKYIIVFARYKSSHWSYPIKKVFLNILQNSQENTCARDSGKKILWHRCFPVNFTNF